MSGPSGAEMDLATSLSARFPELDRLREATDLSVYLVGGGVRDLLLGRARSDLDVVVEGDAATVARALGGEVTEHERFGTAAVRLDGLEIDIAGARAETYPEPGSLPEVRPASLDEDLARRDFTVNAMAIPLQGETRLIDPHGGREDLRQERLRVLHARSFIDDPTRALRAARYAARFGFALEGETERLLRAADLATVSADRRRAELARIAAEPEAVRGFELLAEWGLLDLGASTRELLRSLDALLAAPPWSEVAPRAPTLLAAVSEEWGRGPALAAADPRRPSEGVDAAAGASPQELAIGRALGGGWLDDYVSRWRSIVLEIDGEALIEAGVPEGPAIGRGLRAALARKLDGEISGRERELEAALEAARSGDEVA
jgi:tRNA nucleotidyltransferase (CCA-adding enzyme)